MSRSNRRSVILLALLVAVPAAAAMPLLEPAATTAGLAQPALVAPPVVPGPTLGAMHRLEGPDGSPLDVRIDAPVARIGDDRLVLSLAPAAAAKLQADLLDVKAIAKEGALASDGSVRVLVRGALPLSTDVLDVTASFARLRLVAGTVALQDLATLALDPRVERVFVDGRNEADLAQSVPLIRADQVHQRNDTNGQPILGTGVVIAILDTGVWYQHPDLGGCLGAGCKVAQEENFAMDCSDASDDFGHGTHVAATAAGAYGVAPGATLWNYKVLCQGWGYDSWIIAGIENATLDGADVISMSLGGSGATDTPLAQAVDWAVGQGVVVVSAAGNSGCYGCVGEPATSLRGIAVGATTKWDEMAYFSSRGPVYDSNGDIAGIKPDVSAPGYQIVAAVPTYSCILCDPSGQMSLSGTSMATPHVSGAAALLLQANPSWTPLDVKGALMGHGVQIAGADSRTQGAARIDALSALDATTSIVPGNAWGGLDNSGAPQLSLRVNFTIRNFGASAATIRPVADLGGATTVVSPPAEGPNPTGSPVAVLDAVTGELTGARLAYNGTYDITVTNLASGGQYALAYGGSPVGAPRDAYADGLHAGRYNVTFPAYSLSGLEAEWQLVDANLSGAAPAFRAGPSTFAFSPAEATVAPGASATFTLDVANDNVALKDGWREMSITAGDALGKLTFVKSGVLHLAFDPDTWFFVLERDGAFFDYGYYPGASASVLAPAGSYSVQATVPGCPENATGCETYGSWSFVLVDDVQHASETWIDATPSGTMRSIDVIGRMLDNSTLDPATHGYCNWQARPEPCYDQGEIIFSRAGNDVWFGISGGDSLATMYASDSAWNVGRNLVYNEGSDTYFTGGGAGGIRQDLVFDRAPSQFIEQGVRYAQPPVGEIAMRMNWCSFGNSLSGTGREVLAPRERLLWGTPELPRFPVGVGNSSWIEAVPCAAATEMVLTSEEGDVGDDCFDGGCSTLTTSPFLRPEGGVMTQRRSPWEAAMDLPTQGGDVVVQAGASYMSGSPYATPGQLTMYPHWGWAWDEFFAPATGSLQFRYQEYDNRQTYRVTLDGAQIASGPLTAWSGASWSGSGTVRLEARTSGSIVGTTFGNATYAAEWAGDASPAYLAKFTRVAVENATGITTRVAAGESATLTFGVDAVRTSGVSNVTVTFVNLDTSDAVSWCCAEPGADGLYAVAVPDVGAGPVGVRLSGLAGGASFSLSQDPAYFASGGSGNERPSIEIESPLGGSVVSGVVEVNGTSSDPDGTVQSVEVRVGGGDWRPANGTTWWTYSFNADGYPEGWLTIEARAYDGQAYTYASVAVIVDHDETPPCEIDVAIENVTIERRPIQTAQATLDNDVAERRTVRAVVANLGECDLAYVEIEATARATAWVPGTTTQVNTTERMGGAHVALAAGARVVVTFSWDATGNLGDQDVTVAADPYGWLPESDESNNARTVSTYVLVGGLGGLAVAPIQTPSP